MRINKYIALATGMSRRAADAAITNSDVTINGAPAQSGMDVTESDIISIKGNPIRTPHIFTTIMLNKPIGYICSRDGQGGKTVYDLLPKELHILKPVGRLDKYSTGLLLLTNDGNLANELTHPSKNKEKRYKVALNKPISPDDTIHIQHGVNIGDGKPSVLFVRPLPPERNQIPNGYEVRLSEGRNRQIRRTFEALGYDVKKLQRTQFGSYQLGSLKSGTYKIQ